MTTDFKGSEVFCMSRTIKIYDTTLRDGTQGEEICFSLEDKLRIAQKLDELGIHYIEGGWPGSNPKDISFFTEIKKVPLKSAKVAAFGSTRRAKVKAADDYNIKTLLEAQTPVVTIVGKTWDLHVKYALGVSLEENLELIYDTLSYLKRQTDEVIFDAEHFFDGFKRNQTYGERCGNANLCSIIPNLKLKLSLGCIADEQLTRLREVSHFVSELANLKPMTHQPYVGNSAFAHKGGIHVNAIQKNRETYEHIQPELVGNKQRVLVSDLSGKSNVMYKANEFKIDLKDREPEIKQILNSLKELEHQGYQFEGAEGSFALLMKEALGERKKFFDLQGFRVIVEKRQGDAEPICEATIMLDVNGAVEHTAAIGNGPVNALDNALRKALEKFYPSLKELTLLDYKVRILDERSGTEAKTRVLVESGDREGKWGTVGVSRNIIEASWQALVDAIEYKLEKECENDPQAK